MSKLKERLIDLNLSFNKEIARYVIISVLLIVSLLVITLLTKIYQLFVVLGVVFILYTYLYFSRYKGIEKKRKQNDLIEFVNLFTFFKIYLKNGFGVYQSIKEIASFANESLKNKLDKLIEEIDEDKSITPYINFAHNFEDLVVEEMMISVYQMVDDGLESDYLTQFEIIFDKFSDLLHQNQLSSKDKTLASLTSTAMVGSAYLIVLITFGVITLLGEMLNGL